MSDYNWTKAAMEQPDLSDAERALRDLFVAEYLVDYDHIAAAQRCGFTGQFAKDFANKFMDETYVRRALRAAEEKIPTSKEEIELETAADKQRIVKWLKQEARSRTNSGSARVAALARLVSIYGMDAPTKLEQDVTHRGGVMMVPAIADINAWENSAVASQTKLVEEARSS
jgi:hypothetical protein